MTQIDQIKAEISCIKDLTGVGLNEYDMGHENGVCETCDRILSFIESQEKEPRDCGKGIHKQEYTGCDMSLMDESQRLDEAAEEQAKSFGYMSFDYEFDENVESFKAGAKWMAEQGVSFESAIDYYDGYYLDCEEQEHEAIEKLGVKVLDKVIVQIRKK